MLKLKWDFLQKIQEQNMEVFIQCVLIYVYKILQKHELAIWKNG